MKGKFQPYKNHRCLDDIEDKPEDEDYPNQEPDEAE
jgi:hypothetical protein